MGAFRKEKFELLPLTETKLKGNGEVSLCGVKGIIAGDQEPQRFSSPRADNSHSSRFRIYVI